MRLDRLDLDRFGHFTDRQLTFRSPPAGGMDLHVIYGPNEAGKSTIFAAWLDLLFGMNARNHRHAFLHDASQLQVGARLSEGSQVLELRRIRRASGSLLDRHGAVLPEAALQGMLGGLSREGYSAMFSLDDDTIEKGGEIILASEGELGQILFSGTAGLTELIPRIARLRADLNGFHNGKRSGWLVDARREVEALAAERRALEVSGPALQKLVREAEAARAAWTEARQRLAQTEAQLEHLTRLSVTRPILAEIARLDAELQPLRSLPDATDSEQQQFDRLSAQAEALHQRRAERDLRLQTLRDRLAALGQDAAVLEQAQAMAEAERGRAEHDSALNDLPRRHDTLAEMRRDLGLRLAALGAADADPAGILLDPARMSRLRQLLTARSGLHSAQLSTEAEREKAERLLAREAARLGDPGPASTDDRLEALLRQLRADDPADALRRANRLRDGAAADLQAALARLGPWQGDAAALAALVPPPAWQIAGWRDELARLRQRQADTGRQARDLRQDLERRQAALHAQPDAAATGGVTLAEAALRRGLREAAWAAHLDRLDADSARAFEQALREDDRISALLAEALADSRRAAIEAAAVQQIVQRLAAHETTLTDAQADLAALEGRIAALTADLGLPGAGLDELSGWLDLRAVALERAAALDVAQTALDRATAWADEARGTLAMALGADPAMSFELLMAEGAVRLDAAARRHEARLRLDDLKADLATRTDAAHAARSAFAQWMTAWAEACRDTILAAHDPLSDDFSQLLDRIDQLRELCQAIDAMQDRIVKMEHNRDRVRQARARVATALGVDPASDWDGLLARLRRAQDETRDRAGIEDDITREDLAAREDARLQAATADALADLGTRLGWVADAGTLADHLAACRRATALRGQIARMRQGLGDMPTDAPADDAGDGRESDLTLRLADLRSRLELERAEVDQRYAAHHDLRHRIDEVGGDDAIARLALERESRLEEIRERTRHHLARMAGLAAFEAGLHRYREHHRSSMLSRASDAFRLLTDGAYRGLVAQADGTRETLLALGQDGRGKQAMDLSKGTRFQLYLALRVAGYQELAASRQPVPFIADDILETSDDDRAEAALRLLARMSCTGQVIYLTHHRHLCDMVARTCPGVNIIDLQRPGGTDG